MTKQQIEMKIIENAEKIAKAIKNGKDVEIKTCSAGIKICAVDKKSI